MPLPASAALGRTRLRRHRRPPWVLCHASHGFQDFLLVFRFQRRSFDGVVTCSALALGCLEFSLLPEPVGLCLLPNLASFSHYFFKKIQFYLFADFGSCCVGFSRAAVSLEPEWEGFSR